MNPNAWIIRAKSIEQIRQDYLALNGNIIDEYVTYLTDMENETILNLEKTYMTEETEEIREHRIQQAIEAQKFIQERILHK